jgi:alcohol dehydrogenase class IV
MFIVGKNMTVGAPFEFGTVPDLIVAPGSARHLGQQIVSRFPLARRALLVTDPGFLRTGLVEAPLLDLQRQRIEVVVYSEVVSDPPEAVIQHALDYARRNEIDLVIGLGGGSSMDVAKLIAVLANSAQTLSELYGSDNVTGPRLPLVLLPTTAGTGSEMTNLAIVTCAEGVKAAVVAPQLYADLVLLDAELTLGLSPILTASTGIDAMVHAIEAYTSRRKKNPISDMLARQALTLLSSNLIRACDDGHNLAARQAMQLGACLAGQAFSNAPVAAVHALGYPIGGLFHVAHGLSNSLVLPHVLRINLPEAEQHYAELASMIVPHVAGSTSARAEALIVAMQQIATMAGLATTLQQVGIAEGDLDRLADSAMRQRRLLANNPRELTRDDARAIYTAAL